MTVEVRNPEISYVGNGTADPLAVPFRFLEADHLRVVAVDTNGAETVKVRGTDYSVSGAGAAEGGSVTPLAAIALHITWRISRVTPVEQPTRFTDGYYSAAAQEMGLDRPILALQEIARDVELLEGRSILTQRGQGTVLPPWTEMAGGNKVLGPDPSTGAIGILDGSDFQGIQGEPGLDASQLAETRIFTRADATLATGQTVFPIPFAFVAGVSTVYLGGVRLTPGRHYDDASGTSVILTEPITAYNDDLVVELFHVPSQQEIRVANAAATADAMVRLTNGASLSIALEGTSITYGQDEINADDVTNPPINGHWARRSPRTLEGDLDEALSLVGAAVTVINRGYGGDSTIEGLTRWAAAAPVDFVWLEYGHNDANNYGGHAHGPVTLAAYVANLEAMVIRRVMQGAGVGIIIPPNVQIPAQNAKLHAYRQGARMVAEKYGCIITDAPTILQGLTSPWNDLVHLNSFAISELAWCMAATMLGGAIRSIGAGDVIYADDGMLASATAATMFVDPRAHGGTFLTIPAGGTVLISADFRDNVYPVVHGYHEAEAGPLGIQYAFGASTWRGVAEVISTLDPAKGNRQSIVGQQMRRGVRMFALRNYGVGLYHIEHIRFEVAPAHISRGLAVPSRGMHVCQPMKLSALSASWWCHADLSMRLRAPMLATWFLDLDGAADCGAVIWADPIKGASDFPSDNCLFLMRSGTELRAYERVNGALTAITIAAGAFSAGRARVQMHVTLADGDLKVWLDDAAGPVLTRASTPILSGYPGLIAHRTAYLESFGFLAKGEVKGPYA